MDEPNKINKIAVNGIEYDIEDSSKATKTSELENDSEYVNQTYIETMAIPNSEIEEIINRFV